MLRSITSRIASSIWRTCRKESEFLLLAIRSNLYRFFCGGWFVKEGTHYDIPFLLKIDLLTQEHSDTSPATSVFPMDEDELYQLLDSGYNYFLVAYSGVRPVGFVHYTVEGGYLYIEKIAVHPKFQRLGIGTELIYRLYCFLNPSQPHMEIWLRETNLSALKFIGSLRDRLGLTTSTLAFVGNCYPDTKESGIVLKISSSNFSLERECR